MREGSPLRGQAQAVAGRVVIVRFSVLYLDNGAWHWVVSGNVAMNSSLAWAFFMQGCCGQPALDDEVDHFLWSGDLAPQNNCAPEGCVVDNATVVQVPAGAPWPPAAQAIIDAAGAPPPDTARDAASAGWWHAPGALPRGRVRCRGTGRSWQLSS
jgi:hypothetical protein